MAMVKSIASLSLVMKKQKYLSEISDIMCSIYLTEFACDN